MNDIFLGHEYKTDKEFCIPKKALETHFHLIGGTGKGKTTAIHTMLHPLLEDHRDSAAFFIVDRMGNLSWELLLWMASKYCTESVRQRLVYIEPSREDVVIGFNPLLHETPQHGYYKVQRATDIILRAWENVNIEQMPRLARWTFNAFWAAAQMSLTIGDCLHLLTPGSKYHRELLKLLPESLQYEWAELLRCSPTEVGRLLESTRNRLKPFFESPILRAMFSSRSNRLNMHRFMQEGRIVLLNLMPANRLPQQIADAIGGLVLHEVISTARSLPFGVRHPTYLFLDEFQKFLGPDIEAAIPEVRQLGIKLILSHQSLSQLEQRDIDLTTLIFQAQSRMIFGVQGEDADQLAHELASLRFDPYRIKDEIYSLRQRLSGHRIIDLQSSSFTNSEAENWTKTYGKDWTRQEHVTHYPGRDLKGEGLSRAEREGSGTGGARASGHTHGTSEHLLPVHEDYVELARRTYFTFEEDRSVFARDIRRLPRGQALLRLVDDPELYHVDVKRDMPGHLSWDAQTLMEYYPEAVDAMYRLIEQNFASDLFVSPAQIEAEAQRRLQQLLRPAVTVASSNGADGRANHAADAKHPLS